MLFGERFDDNPKFAIPPGYHDMVTLWRMFAGGGLAPGYLPDRGGAIDQPAIMIDAFAAMSRVKQAIDKHGLSAELQGQ